MAVWRRVGIATAAVVLAGGALLLAGAPRSAAQGGAAFGPDPLVLVVGVDQVQTVAVRIANIQHLYAGEVHLQFDPSVVEVVDADLAQDGIQISPGDFPAADSILLYEADNVSGTIDYAVTSVSPSPESNGSGIFCTISFRGKIAGQSSPLSLRSTPESILAVVPSMAAAPYVWQDGVLRVGYVIRLPLVTRGGQYSVYLPLLARAEP